MQGTKCWCLQLSSGHWTEKETIYEIERNGMKMSLRVIYKFVKNIELVAVDPSKVQTMNSSSEKLPPGQIEDLWNACFDGLVDCNSQNDSHTFESLTNEPGGNPFHPEPGRNRWVSSQLHKWWTRLQNQNVKAFEKVN